MSILNVEHLSHGFGDRAIFEDVSFRLLKGEHIGLVGANGEGKSTFMNIITGKLMPDEGKVEWAKNVRVGYLDQHTVLEKGMTIRDVLKSAFSWLYEMEERMNTICDSMGDASEDELNQMMEELGVIQEMMDAHDFYILDSRAYRKDLAEGIVPEVAKGEKEAIRVVGAHNIIFLAAIVVAVILSGILPSTKVFGGGIHIFGEVKLTYAAIIEVVIILAAAFLSFKTTNKSVREDNHFSWGAIQEVAVLPEFRRKKYGDFIVRLLIDKAMLSGAQTIEADVLQGAEILFQEVGFAEAGAWYEKEGRQWQPMQLQAGNIHKCCNCGQ